MKTTLFRHTRLEDTLPGTLSTIFMDNLDMYPKSELTNLVTGFTEINDGKEMSNILYITRKPNLDNHQSVHTCGNKISTKTGLPEQYEIDFKYVENDDQINKLIKEYLSKKNSSKIIFMEFNNFDYNSKYIKQIAMNNNASIILVVEDKTRYWCKQEGIQKNFIIGIFASNYVYGVINDSYRVLKGVNVFNDMDAPDDVDIKKPTINTRLGWASFKKGNFAVECFDTEIARLFLEKCIEKDIRWYTKGKIDVESTANMYASTSSSTNTYGSTTSSINFSECFKCIKLDNQNGLIISRSRNESLPILQIRDKDNLETLQPKPKLQAYYTDQIEKIRLSSLYGAIGFHWDGFKRGQFAVQCNDMDTTLLFISGCISNNLFKFEDISPLMEQIFDEYVTNEDAEVFEDKSFGDCFIFLPYADSITVDEDSKESTLQFQVCTINEVSKPIMLIKREDIGIKIDINSYVEL